MGGGPVGSWPGRYPPGLRTLDFPEHASSQHTSRTLHTPLPTQVPEDFGPVRTVAEGRGDTLYVGTTRNSILLGSVHTGFSLLVQVSAAPPPRPSSPASSSRPSPNCTSFILTATTITLSSLPRLHFFLFLLTSLPRPFLLGREAPHPVPSVIALLFRPPPTLPWPRTLRRVTCLLKWVPGTPAPK